VWGRRALASPRAAARAAFAPATRFCCPDATPFPARPGQASELACWQSLRRSQPRPLGSERASLATSPDQGTVLTIQLILAKRGSRTLRTAGRCTRRIDHEPSRASDCDANLPQTGAFALDRTPRPGLRRSSSRSHPSRVGKMFECCAQVRSSRVREKVGSHDVV